LEVEMSEIGQNTNLASEYYILSMLYRIGSNAHLTLGNKKSVDIVVDNGSELITIDVKGLKGTTSFPVDNCKKYLKSHFIIFISFLNRMPDPNIIPEIYIVPSLDLEKLHKELNNGSLIYRNPKGNRAVVQLSNLRKLALKYQDKWDHFR
jgi:hypothetical protein